MSENVTKKILPSNQTMSGNVVISTIEITEENYSEKVKIICTASNEIGEDSHEFIIESRMYLYLLIVFINEIVNSFGLGY